MDTMTRSYLKEIASKPDFDKTALKIGEDGILSKGLYYICKAGTNDSIKGFGGNVFVFIKDGRLMATDNLWFNSEELPKKDPRWKINAKTPKPGDKIKIYGQEAVIDFIGRDHIMLKTAITVPDKRYTAKLMEINDLFTECNKMLAED